MKSETGIFLCGDDAEDDDDDSSAFHSLKNAAIMCFPSAALLSFLKTICCGELYSTCFFPGKYVFLDKSSHLKLCH